MTDRVKIRIGSRWIGEDEPLFLIAEAGVNHENSFETALRMIDAAAEAGADAIKFQSYKAGSLASKNSPSYWDRTKEPAASQYELFRRFDHFGLAEYRALAEHADKCGIIFMTTCFDEFFVDELGDLLPAFKIASADITHLGLIEKIAGKGKPVFLSVGAATLGEIDNAVRLIRANDCSEIALLHCVLNYPCPPENANLRSICSLKRLFPDVVIGYSDHVPPEWSILQLSAAWMLGARVVEKHFTLDKTLPGNDHYHAMDPADISNFRRQQQYLESLLGVERVGYAPSEDSARKFARRSLVAASKIPAGHPVTPEMIAVKRPGTGIDPQFIRILLGARPLRDIEEDTILQWPMFIDGSSR